MQLCSFELKNHSHAFPSNIAEEFSDNITGGKHRGQRSGHLGSSPNSATRVTGAVRQALYTLGLSFFIHSMRIRI